ncbi:hypothetical protein [Pinisolibacter sp.]|uniref:hypothetical protein n=1 Tax=Pinisolibacter sp. TaxID=2172024 RepID=UPI002FDE171E
MSKPPADRFDHVADVIAWLFLTLLLLIPVFSLGFLFGGWFAPSTHERSWLYDYQGLVGAAMTLIAAGVAWLAVQRQISAQRSLSEAEYRDAKNFVISSFEDYLRIINLIWREIEHEPTSIEVDKWNLFISRLITKIMSCSVDLDRQLQKTISRTDYAKNSLRISDRFKIDEICMFANSSNEQILTFINNKNYYTNINKINDDNQFILETFSTLIQFSHLRKACIEFDPSLEEIFIDRKIVPVNWDPMWRHLEEFTNQYQNIP